MFKVSLGKIYLTQGDTARFNISLPADSEYQLTEDDQVYFIVTNDDTIVDIDDIINGEASCLFYKEGLEIVLNPEDTESLERGTYYYQVRVVLAQGGDINTIIEPQEFNITPLRK